MRSKFEVLTFRDYIATCKSTGETMELICQTTTDALYTGAEMFDVPVHDITITRPEEW